MKTIEEVLARYYEVSGGKWKLKQDARAAPGGIPKGSRWFPGCPGDPACEECDGIGLLRLDLPAGHPVAGRVFLCTCVDQMRGNG